VTRSIYVGGASNSAERSLIWKGAKRQSICLVLMMANRWQFKFGRSQLKSFKSVCSDNNHLPSLKTFHFDEIIVHC